MGNGHAFSNSYGGWIVFGIKEKRAGGKSVYETQGVDHTEKIEQDFVNVLRSNTKFNQRQSTSTDADNVEQSLPERVLTLIEANKRISIAELANSTNQSKSSIDRVIAELKRNAKLSRSGTARNGQWILL
ncbi:MAG: hypothetical protein HDS84_08955 [Bacteroidales bacterium]|nr:hypothetical protein [Bacteroidales bacterium]